jgi:hypothetical protein
MQPVRKNPQYAAIHHLTAAAPACAIWASSFESTPDTPIPPTILPPIEHLGKIAPALLS